MRETISRLAPGAKFVDKQADADKIVVLLTGNVLECEPAISELRDGVDRLSHKSVIYVYTTAWDWGKLYRDLGSSAEGSARHKCCLSIQAHEAICHREVGGPAYEHETMCLRVIEVAD